jgi:hypothetical protein
LFGASRLHRIWPAINVGELGWRLGMPPGEELDFFFFDVQGICLKENE